jgi:hypothetical protein
VRFRFKLMQQIRFCLDCGTSFEVTDDEVRRVGELTDAGTLFRLPRRCPNCRHARRQARDETVVDDGRCDWLICSDCGQQWMFGSRDKAYYRSQGWTQPKRCKECRQARRRLHASQPHVRALKEIQ